MELDDGVTVGIADAVITLLEAMKDKNDKSIFAKVTLGRIDRLAAHNGPVSEVYVNDETDFEYDLGDDEHISEKVEIIIAIYTKGVQSSAERNNLNIKDTVLKLIENNPSLDDLTSECRILRVENGRRAEGTVNKPLLFGASMIHVEYTCENFITEDPEDMEINMEVDLT